MRWLTLPFAAIVATAVLAASAAPASAYGKATWQAAMTGTFVYPGTGGGFGFWGWCDFAGGVTSGTDADCQVAEYVHAHGASGWTCELTVDATSWDESVGSFFGFPTFHVTGRVTVRPDSLTELQKDACIGFYATGDPTALVASTTLTDVDTFMPAAPGHYDFSDIVPVFGATGEFNFTVAQVP